MGFEHDPDDYNYADFDLARELPLFEAFRERLHVGERAPDHELLRLEDGERVHLSDYWANGPVVMEFGSFT